MEEHKSATSPISEEQLKAFLEAIKGDTALLESLEAATDLDAVVAIAKDAGFAISEAEVLTTQAADFIELSDEELEDVAGGCWNTGGVCILGTLWRKRN